MDHSFQPKLNLITISSPNWEDTVNSWRNFFDYEVFDTGYIEEDLAQTWNAPNNVDSRYAILYSKLGDQSIGIRIVENSIPSNFESLRTFGWSKFSLIVENINDAHSQIKESPFEIISPIRTVDTNILKVKTLDFKGLSSEIVSFIEIIDLKKIEKPIVKTKIDRPFSVTLATRDMETSQKFFYNKLSIEKSIDFEGELWSLSDAFQYNRDTTYAQSSLQMGNNISLEINEYPEDAKRRDAIPGHLMPGISHITMTVPYIEKLPLYWLTEPLRLQKYFYNGLQSVTFYGASGELIELIEQTN